MPKLVDAVQTELTTDFAILAAVQEDLHPDHDPTASFATSVPGAIGLQAGHKNSRIGIRVERWDERPPREDGWEDFDDVPFEEVPAAGKLIVSGFDAGDIGLDVSDFGRGWVEVFARGRHRYHYGSNADVSRMEPEEWLLRLYPHEGRADPLAGGPRRLAGGIGTSWTFFEPWLAALRGFRTLGWSDALAGSNGFNLARLALYPPNPPVTPLELAKRMVGRMPPYEVGGEDAETVLLPPRSRLDKRPDPLAEISGRGDIATIGDSIEALISIGLLLVERRGGTSYLVPNPAPQPAWERFGTAGEELVRMRSRALEETHYRVTIDLLAALGWCTDGLTATPLQMAIRWCTGVEDVLGGLRMLGGSGRVSADRELGFDTDLDPDEAITLTRRRVAFSA